MKKNLAILGSILLLSTGAAMGQSAPAGTTPNNSVSGVNSDTTRTESTGHDVTGFSSKMGPGTTTDDVRRAPNPNVVLHPRLGGVFVEGGKYGTQLISPVAPASYGMGERYLAAPDPRYDVDHMSGPAAHRDAGGIKLLSLEF